MTTDAFEYGIRNILEESNLTVICLVEVCREYLLPAVDNAVEIATRARS